MFLLALWTFYFLSLFQEYNILIERRIFIIFNVVGIISSEYTATPEPACRCMASLVTQEILGQRIMNLKKTKKKKKTRRGGFQFDIFLIEKL